MREKYKNWFLGKLLGRSFRLKYYKENGGESIWGIRQAILDDTPAEINLGAITQKQLEEIAKYVSK